MVHCVKCFTKVQKDQHITDLLSAASRMSVLTLSKTVSVEWLILCADFNSSNCQIYHHFWSIDCRHIFWWLWTNMKGLRLDGSFWKWVGGWLSSVVVVEWLLSDFLRSFKLTMSSLLYQVLLVWSCHCVAWVGWLEWIQFTGFGWGLGNYCLYVISGNSLKVVDPLLCCKVIFDGKCPFMFIWLVCV